jgi:hypothetical protein
MRQVRLYFKIIAICQGQTTGIVIDTSGSSLREEFTSYAQLACSLITASAALPNSIREGQHALGHCALSATDSRPTFPADLKQVSRHKGRKIGA